MAFYAQSCAHILYLYTSVGLQTYRGQSETCPVARPSGTQDLTPNPDCDSLHSHEEILPISRYPSKGPGGDRSRHDPAPIPMSIINGHFPCICLCTFDVEFEALQFPPLCISLPVDLHFCHAQVFHSHKPFKASGVNKSK